MSYLHEVYIGQIYDIDGERFEVVKIRATNVVSARDYIIAVTFRNKHQTFDTGIEKVIGNPEYKLINKS